MHIIKFSQRVGTYNPGEQAGFPAHIAEKYIAMRYATLVEVVPDRATKKKPSKASDAETHLEDPVAKVIEPRTTKREYITK